MNENERTMKCIKCLTAWFSNQKDLLITPFRKRDERFPHKKRVAHRNLAIHFIGKPSRQRLPAKFWGLNRTNLFDSSTNQPLFPLCLPFCNFSISKIQETVWYLFLITWWIMWLFFPGCTFCAGIYFGSSVVSWVTFFGYSMLLLLYILRKLSPSMSVVSGGWNIFH